MSADRYTLDANVLVYALDPNAAGKHAIARRLVEAATERNCLFTTQTLAETYNVIAKKQPAHAQEAYKLLSALSVLTPVITANAEDLQAAMSAHRFRPIHFWDAMLWATARRHGCTIILTEDQQDKPMIDGVRYLNPFTCAGKQLEPFT